MSEQFIKKNIKLSLEFDRYVVEHPDLFKSIPNGAYVIVTLKNDAKFSQQSRKLVKEPRRKKVVEAQKAGSTWTISPFQFSAA
jgi:hypothetical protein